MSNLKEIEYAIGTRRQSNNCCMFEGFIGDIKKAKGLVKSFHLEIERTGRPGLNEYDSPIIVVNDDLSLMITKYMKKDIWIKVRASIRTEVKGGYGTVTIIEADAITFISDL